MNPRHLRLIFDADRAQHANVKVKDHEKTDLHINNFSRSGLFIGGNLPFNSGEKIQLTFSLPQLESEIKALANVQWGRKEAVGNYLPEGLGVHFLEIQSEAKEAFERYVDDQILAARAGTMMDAAPYELSRAMLEEDDMKLSSTNSFEEICQIFAANNVVRLPVVEEGRIIGLLSAQKMLQFLIESLRIQKARTVSEMIQLSSIFAHEMSTPLSALKIAQDLIQSGEMADAQRNELDEIINVNTQLAFNLLETLHDLKSLTSGTISLVIDKHEVGELFTMLRKVFKLAFRSKEIELAFEPEMSSQKIRCDLNKLNQSLSNLLSNALKYSKPKTKVVMRFHQDKEHNYISVIDQGLGISAEDQKKLFQPFTRLSNKPTAGERSTGLGLSVAHKIVQAHGGNIDVTSSPDGSCFTIKLPK